MKKVRIPPAPKSVIGRAAMVLSPQNKRGRVPDESSPAERAEWIGRPIEIKGRTAIIIDAIKYYNCWFLQYTDAPKVQQ